MSDIAIRVENLSKQYRIGTANSPSYHRLSEALTGIPRMAWNALRNNRTFSPRPASGRGVGGEGTGIEPVDSLQPQATSLQPASDFWALKDVSFEVKQGEVVGIIGRNGAGKSTLLKILSRITEPTSGRFGIRGRVASLLEVGTGFHPELTGRENIFVSGITLGMTRAEIKQRFDEIVEFSGVEKFLDTPVKHYSSGMQVRLGFAVAAHLESEILIIDEVLAVGDARFQKQCMQRISSMTEFGRTVVVVSHSMEAICSRCSRVMLLNQGKVDRSGLPEEVVAYYSQSEAQATRDWTEESLSPGNEHVRLLSVASSRRGDTPTNWVWLNEDIWISIRYRIMTKHWPIVPVVRVNNSQGTTLFTLLNTDDSALITIKEPGVYESAVVIPADLLAPGTYMVTIGLSTFAPVIKHVREENTIAFSVLEPERADAMWSGAIHGVLRPSFEWHESRVETLVAE